VINTGALQSHKFNTPLTKAVGDISPSRSMEDMISDDLCPSRETGFSASQASREKSYAIAGEGEEVVVGRSSSSIFPFKHRNVSRQHAVIRRKEGKLWVKDLSEKGTRLNGLSLEKGKWTELNSGDDLGLSRFGNHIYVTGDESCGMTTDMDRWLNSLDGCRGLTAMKPSPAKETTAEFMQEVHSLFEEDASCDEKTLVVNCLHGRIKLEELQEMNHSGIKIRITAGLSELSRIADKPVIYDHGAKLIEIPDPSKFFNMGYKPEAHRFRLEDGITRAAYDARNCLQSEKNQETQEYEETLASLFQERDEQGFTGKISPDLMRITPIETLEKLRDNGVTIAIAGGKSARSGARYNQESKTITISQRGLHNRFHLEPSDLARELKTACECVAIGDSLKLETDDTLARFQECLLGMVSGHELTAAVPFIAAKLKARMDFETLRQLKQFGVKIAIPGDIPDRFKEEKYAGTYTRDSKLITVPSAHLYSHEGTTIIHEFAHAYDHLLYSEEEGADKTLSDDESKKSYHSVHSEKITDAYRNFHRRVSAMDVAKSAHYLYTVWGKKKEATSRSNLPATYQVAQLEDGRYRIEINWETDMKRKLKKFRNRLLAGLITAPAVAAAATTFPIATALGAFGIAALIGIPKIAARFKTSKKVEKPDKYQERTERARQITSENLKRKPYSEIIELPGGQKIEFQFSPGRDVVLLPGDIDPTSAFRSMKWSDYAYKSGNVEEYYAESVARGSDNLKGSDPGAYELYNDSFSRPGASKT